VRESSGEFAYVTLPVVVRHAIHIKAGHGDGSISHVA